MDRLPLKRAALLWDESFLWGVMAHRALASCGLACDIIRAADVRSGRLRDYSALFVPGGWASNKIKALGDGGVDAVMQFVRNGGSYVGFCGGAGLATEDGIGLLPVRRRPTKDRVPSFSGPIRLTVTDHALWRGIADPVFHAWWPSQFTADNSVAVLATYGEALPDAFSSDVNVGDARSLGAWSGLERTYGINLDPERLRNEPAVLEGTCGKGRVVLSLIHFDTPDDLNGAIVLGNLWNYLAAGEERTSIIKTSGAPPSSVPALAAIQDAVAGLIDLGSRNFLWIRRNPLLLQWRRGVRGLEYCTLEVLTREIAGLLRESPGISDPKSTEMLSSVRELLLPFVEKAKQLLVMERFALQNGHITYERCDDPEITALRIELFSRSKSHGGRFKEVIDALDNLLFCLLTGR
ncbi:MAG: BPL-N domain-containing protein [Nitrospirota bacterium]|nr:BPL-N domain-containing protein [Nitrospirota bacterium]